MSGFEWAEALVRDDAWVLHAGTGVVGRVESCEADGPTGPTVTVVPGHVLVAKDENLFVRLSDEEAVFCVDAVRATRLYAGGMMGQAARLKVARVTATRILVAVLSAQIRELQKAA